MASNLIGKEYTTKHGRRVRVIGLGAPWPGDSGDRVLVLDVASGKYWNTAAAGVRQAVGEE